MISRSALAALALSLLATPALAFPVTVDNCGRTLTFDKAPDHAVIHDLNMSEMAFALDLTLVAVVAENAGRGSPVVRTVNVTGPYSFFGSQAPAAADSGYASPVELGLRFTPTQNGFISGVRFYKSTSNKGTHIGNLWTASGQLLATGTFTNETASGW